MSKINYFNKTGEEIESSIVNIAEKLIGESLLEGDERRALIKGVSYFILQLGKTINYTGANNFLRYADENNLELLGEYKNVSRKQAEKARSTVEFIREGNLENKQGIPLGTKVAAGSIIFKTIENKSFSINQNKIEIEIECETPGTIGNNFLPGQINLLIDVIPFVTQINNVTKSDGGSDLEDIENYRTRIREAPEGFSVAGPKGAYEFWTKTIDSTISDVTVQSSTPGVVEIFPLIKDGKLPSDELMNKITALFNRDNIRPLTDLVKINSPEEKIYKINLTYYISKSNEQYTNSINNKVSEEVKKFVEETKTKLGVDINPDKLVSKLINIGVKRVEIISPKFTKVDKTQIAIGEIEKINFGEIEDD